VLLGTYCVPGAVLETVDTANTQELAILPKEKNNNFVSANTSVFRSY
jgi:hypothetical protein